MIKKTFLKSYLLLLCLIVGGVNYAWSAEEVYKTALFGSTYNSTKIGDYTSTWTSTNSGFTVSLSNFNNNNNGWDYVKCGRKNTASVASIITSNAIDKAITKVAVTIDAITAGKVNSIKLYTSTNNSTWTEAGSFDESTGAKEVSLSSPTANLYYKIEFNCASGTSNGLVTVSKVEYYYNPPIAVTGVTLNESSANLKVGETLDLTATVAPANATNKNVSWSSSAPSVASVENGTVTAVSPGDAVITVTTEDGSKTATCAVKVVAADAVMPPTFSVADGTSIELGSTVTITAPEGCTLKYQLGSGDVEAVAARTEVVTLSTVGDDVTLKAWSVKDTKESDPASISLTVTKHPISLSFSSDAVEVVRGENVAAPALSGNTGNGTVTYSSADETIATVNSSTRQVTGEKAGSTTITATVAETAEYLGGSATFDVTVTKPYHTVTFSVNGNTTSDDFQESDIITFPDNPADINGMTFVGWYTSTYNHASKAPSYVDTESETMGTSDVTYYAVYADRTPGTQTTVTDELTRETTGVTNGSTTYSEWSGKTATSDAVYAGNSAGGNDAIQLRTTNSNSGIISTTSGGKVKKVVLKWNSNTSNGRTVDIYGKNSAYSEAADTYDNNKQGTELGSIVYGTSTELNVTGDYTYVGLRSNSGALYLDKVSIIWETGTPDTYSNYNTTVSLLPLPVITMADVEMTWGDTDKSVAPSATVGDKPYDGSFNFTSSNGNLIVAADGKLTCDVPGTYTVTASIDATAEHQAASVDCTVTVGKKDATLTFAEPTVQKLIADETYTQVATKTPAGAGDVTYSITPSGNAVNVSTGAVTLTNTGNYTVTATAAENTLYNEATASYTLQVRTTPTIDVEDKTIAYGETFTVDDEMIEGGVITVVPSNTAIATASGLVLTSAAVGSTVVTVRTAADDTYIAGVETFTLTVTAPEALSEKPSAEPIVLFNETFDKCDGTGGRDGNYTGNIGTSATTGKLDESWTTIGDNGASKCIKLGTGSNRGTVTTSNISLSGNGILTFSAAGWGDDNTNTVEVTASGATLSGDTNVTLAGSTWNSYSVSITEATGSVAITFSMKRGFLDDVKVVKPGVDIATVPVTVSTSGYATYCCQYPLDLSTLDSKVKAYIVTAVTADAVTFTKITGTIKGGVPFILYGTPGGYDLTVAASSSNVYDDNKLVGTLAPTFVEQEVGGYTNFALSATYGDFRKIKDDGMVVPANKVYLPVQSSLLGGSARMAIIFDDDETTTVQGVAVRKDVPATYYNLKGQRVENPVKGQLYIVNGKKVVVK